MGVPILAVTGFSVPQALFVFQSSLLWSIAFLFRLEFFSAEVEAKFGSRGSPNGESLLKLELWAKPGSRRSQGEVFLQSRLKAKSGSRRSPDKAYRQLLLSAEPGSRRSPGGVVL